MLVYDSSTRRLTAFAPTEPIEGGGSSEGADEDAPDHPDDETDAPPTPPAPAPPPPAPEIPKPPKYPAWPTEDNPWPWPSIPRGVKAGLKEAYEMECKLAADYMDDYEVWDEEYGEEYRNRNSGG